MIDLSKNILYEDKDIIVLDKPAGLVVHPDGRTDEPSVSGWFGVKFPEALKVGESLKLSNGTLIERPGIVHRLDRETSGVLLLAKTEAGYMSLKNQFQKREIEKIYHLFVHGNIKDDLGTIALPIARSASNFRKRSAERGAIGEKREAVTHFKVLKRASDKSFTFIEAKPATGRTHQIRVHFKALHHPVVCDKLYAPGKPCILGFNRLALHARAITFKTTANLSSMSPDAGQAGKKITVEATYPTDFMKAMDNVR
ncbi:MAG: RluA family pseudouridine synthase [Candidatus Zambryskibacteria bacterium CG_4_9_14_3_um_filter_42_9]|uniref:Pseudouridine synthase n=1 Tax=Candidatus Zambryskibacteria bacterium CG22_combo_CG10-13_8_21_14_all_42_17 TaxID=1975118 RepID=A0A2H0BDU9_9BACT|nr:MAG: RluA family pseudouridine synthase [Candidatus Zambryskibacteria bacterium CG22_combo_CG10-13_8_21_14_all_42_17]PJA37052.1 MAG: RluA family pseudouridine synthase [Candidatus Zambryskibacteria bacterium CG_4_9_14_3_um_filter_42_9]